MDAQVSFISVNCYREFDTETKIDMKIKAKSSQQMDQI